VKQVRSNWTRAFLVCRKCSKKAGGGFGPDGTRSLAKALRREAGGKGRKARFGVVEVRCLGICPRGGVVVIDAADPEHWRVISAGTDPSMLFEEPVRSSDLS
jgi:predicted metal-binding protein